MTNENFMMLYNDKNTKWFCHTCSDNPFSKCKVTLPSPDLVLSSIEQAEWGVLKGSEITEVVTDIYSKIIKWKKNMFKVPTGKAGQDFIEEVAKTMTLYTSGSHFESVVSFNDVNDNVSSSSTKTISKLEK